MARFRFRLQPLLHYREYRTEQAKHELARLAEQISTLERELEFLSIERERAELRLVERMQEQDVLERLRQRRYEEYMLEERRDEQRQLDDIAGRRHQAA